MSIHSTSSYLWAVTYLWIVNQHHYSIKSDKYIQLCDNLQTIRNISIKSTSSLNPLYKQPSFQTQKSNWCLSGTIPAFSVTSYKQTTECSLLCLSFVTKLNAFEVQSCIHIATFCSFLLMNIFYMYIPQNVLIYSPVDGYLGCFLFSMIMTKDTMSIPKQNCVCTCFHFSWINFREQEYWDMW